MRKFWRWAGSYLWGIKLGEYTSPVSGTLELCYINGRKMLNGPNVNYSFGELHRVFERAFRSTGLRHNPPGSVLILGFGAGSVAHILHKQYGFACTVTGVDLDPVMLQLAQDEFGITPSQNLHLLAADALDFVAADTGTYDMAVVDIFVDDQVPESIVSRTFIQQVLARLTPQGRLYINLMTTSPNGKRQVHTLQRMDDLGRMQLLHPRPGNVVLYVEKISLNR